MVNQADLKKWLAENGIASGFYFPEGFNGPDYLNPDHSRYSKRLVAAIEAWQALADFSGKSPKAAAVEWITARAEAYDLLHRNGAKKGMPVTEPIENIAQIVNWEPDGGAPTTPSRKDA